MYGSVKCDGFSLFAKYKKVIQFEEYKFKYRVDKEVPKMIGKFIRSTVIAVLVSMTTCLFSLDAQAAEKTMEMNVYDWAECEWLIEEAKGLVAELCEGAEDVTVVIPNDDNFSVAKNVVDYTDDDSAYIMASKTIGKVNINGITYVEKEETLIALYTLEGSYSASGQKYGVAASNVVNITWSYSANLSDLSITFNSMTAKYTNLPTVSSEVTKMEYSASLQPPYGAYTYLETNSVSNPSEGIPYTTLLNSNSFLLGGDTGYAMITIYYANGDSATYEGSLNAAQ